MSESGLERGLREAAVSGRTLNSGTPEANFILPRFCRPQFGKTSAAKLDERSRRRFAKLKALAAQRVAEWEKLHTAAVEFQPKMKAWREEVCTKGYQPEVQEAIKECLEKGSAAFRAYPVDKQERLRKSAAFRRALPDVAK